VPAKTENIKTSTLRMRSLTLETWSRIRSEEISQESSQEAALNQESSGDAQTSRSDDLDNTVGSSKFKLPFESSASTVP
jgi:hypothetical protein